MSVPIVSAAEIGATLTSLRLQGRLSQQSLASTIGTTTAYLAKLEEGLVTPTQSYVGKILDAVVKLLDAPPRPCLMLGCTVTHEPDEIVFHHADTIAGDWGSVEVRKCEGQDEEWTTYLRVEDDYATDPGTFRSIDRAYKTASALAVALNRHPAAVTR
ncbi:helix-turn-helix protein [Curtobacterium sp. PhB172]|uniref:helix-turn-helix domain-containing protein n=1 Tax=Curtobacterium sp. PhB172 TaxID=2485196 RepID=UPI000F4C1B1B|nr:helix-turn-helix transcriptional regulator [Curtobacterium sp. PhB172]ROS63881.1 helix-turn-helix protein [Curtobacterium sp. PhB172]